VHDRMVCFWFPSSWAKTAFYFHFDRANLILFAAINVRTGEWERGNMQKMKKSAQNVHNFFCPRSRFLAVFRGEMHESISWDLLLFYISLSLAQLTTFSC
jgi:hypothetical protein